MKIEKRKLSNGIQVFLIKYPETELVASNVIVGAGGRYENTDTYGISHFLEHMVFKGTKSFPNSEVFAKELEDRGAVINAWTSEQATCFWNIIPKENIDIALKALSEQISAPLFEQTEIDKERGPVLEEIKRAHDDPYSYVWHNILDIMWPKQAIGAGVLGPEGNIKKFNKEDFENYLKEFYVTGNMNICVVSSLESDEIMEHLEKHFSSITEGPRREPSPIKHQQTEPHLRVSYRDIKQGHLILAYKTFGVNDSRRPSLDILMNILGTGMGSLLFKEVREKRGLAYALNGELDYFSDAGAAYLYAGVNSDKAEEAVTVMKQIIEDLKKKPLPTESVEKAKEFLRGIILYFTDGVQKGASWYTTKSMLDEKRLDPQEYLKAISKVTAGDVQAMVNEIFIPKNETLLVLGPFKDEEKFAKILAR